MTTPSAVALADVRKAVEMFRQVNVEILGVVENMSYFPARTARAKIRRVRPRRKASIWLKYSTSRFSAKLKSILRSASAATLETGRLARRGCARRKEHLRRGPQRSRPRRRCSGCHVSPHGSDPLGARRRRRSPSAA